MWTQTPELQDPAPRRLEEEEERRRRRRRRRRRSWRAEQRGLDGCRRRSSIAARSLISGEPSSAAVIRICSARGTWSLGAGAGARPPVTCRILKDTDESPDALEPAA
ncbi:unnamed protein product [Pleuronectes platessa]|uniref:Uncharacterized protein n=1 Tax=Pleuronectes platessa TaxID=8262 RepID=A0A9N7TNT0_PLEPL|nr:unnamed protein product [Pleuronectes platessa]